MWDYTAKVMEHFLNPRNVGEILDANAIGEVGSVVCGDALKLYLKIQNDRIVDAKFKTFGCASAIASSSALTEIIKGKNLEEAGNVTNEEIAAYLGGLPQEKMHCSVMGREALEAAIANYRGEAKDTSKLGKLVCECFGIYEEQIKRAVRENFLTSVQQVTNYTKASGGCGKCHDEVQRIITQVLAELESTSAGKKKSKLSNVERMKLVMETIEKEIKPALRQDGGDIELVEIEGSKVYVNLLGNCTGCPVSGLTLGKFVQEKLREFVDETIEVVSASKSQI